MVKNEKSKKLKIAIIIFLATALIVTAFTTVLALGENNEGYRTITVIEISGTVGVVHDNMEYPAYTGMHLEEGYSVVTSGNSYIRMCNRCIRINGVINVKHSFNVENNNTNWDR